MTLKIISSDVRNIAMWKNIFEVTAKFDEDITRLSWNDRDALIETLELFLSDSNNSALRNHALRENESAVRSITIHDDLRLILRIRSENSFLLLRIGTHDDVY